MKTQNICFFIISFLSRGSEITFATWEIEGSFSFAFVTEFQFFLLFLFPKSSGQDFLFVEGSLLNLLFKILLCRNRRLREWERQGKHYGFWCIGSQMDKLEEEKRSFSLTPPFAFCLWLMSSRQLRGLRSLQMCFLGKEVIAMVLFIEHVWKIWGRWQDLGIFFIQTPSKQAVCVTDASDLS